MIEENEAVSEASSGFPYQLTDADRAKGRATVTPKKILANRLNPLKSGKFSQHSSDFVWCNSCSLRQACHFYQKDSNCRIMGVAVYKNLARLWSANPAESLMEMSRALGELHVSIKIHGGKPRHLSNYVALLAKIFELRFGSKQLVGLAGFESKTEFIVCGYGGARLGGLDCPVCCKTCGAQGKLLEVIEFKPDELEAIKREGEILPQEELMDNVPQSNAESEPAVIVEAESISGGVSVVEPVKKEESKKQELRELQWPYGHKLPYF